MESLEFGRWFITMHEIFWKRNWEIDTWNTQFLLWKIPWIGDEKPTKVGFLKNLLELVKKTLIIGTSTGIRKDILDLGTQNHFI